MTRTTLFALAAPAHALRATLAEQIDALLLAQRKARREGLSEVAALLTDRAHALIDQYADTNELCDSGHPLDARGMCPTCIENAEQLAAARTHAGETARTIDPFCGF